MTKNDKKRIDDIFSCILPTSGKQLIVIHGIEHPEKCILYLKEMGAYNINCNTDQGEIKFYLRKLS
jgi:hypothetical protein